MKLSEISNPKNSEILKFPDENPLPLSYCWLVRAKNYGPKNLNEMNFEFLEGFYSQGLLLSKA